MRMPQWTGGLSRYTKPATVRKKKKFRVVAFRSKAVVAPGKDLEDIARTCRNLRKPKSEQKTVCFSAPASFVTAGITGVVGIVALTRVNEPRELPLAATPLLFALQQGIEGLLWLNLPLAHDGSLAMALTVLYLFFAEAFWPSFAPIAVWLIEPNRHRRLLMVVCIGVGTSVGAYLLWWILVHPHFATILDGHIVYLTEYRHSDAVGLAYLAATGLPLLLSSQRIVVALGAIVLAGVVAAYAFYWQAFISVWCFFAAAASVTILCHFEWSRRSRLRAAGV